VALDGDWGGRSFGSGPAAACFSSESTMLARKNDNTHTGSGFSATRGYWWPASCPGGAAS
jgi:hypothetical protein